jgi:hypothetical protein
LESENDVIIWKYVPVAALTNNTLIHGENMKTFAAVLLILLGSMTAYAQKLDGVWKGTRSGPNGDFELTFTFKVKGDSLGGEVASQMGSMPLQNGKIHDNRFSYDIDINGQTFSSTGVLEGDVVKITGSRRPEPMILHRVKEDSKINGAWLAKVQGPQGDMELTFTFKVDGNKLVGTDSSAMGSIPLTNGVVQGNEFSFDIEMQEMKISHKCKYLDDDSIEMKANVMEQDMIIKLKRVK